MNYVLISGEIEDKQQYMQINIDRLREDLRRESLGAYFGGGFGGALIESFDVESATAEELIEMAKNKGFILDNYIL